MEISDLHNCSFWVNIEDTNVCFKVGRPDGTGVNITKVLANDEWQVILPVQVSRHGSIATSLVLHVSFMLG